MCTIYKGSEYKEHVFNTHGDRAVDYKEEDKHDANYEENGL